MSVSGSTYRISNQSSTIKEASNRVFFTRHLVVEAFFFRFDQLYKKKGMC